LALLARPVYAQAAPPLDVHAETDAARDLLTQAMAAYRMGDYQSAFRLSRSAYLDHFERIELPLRVINQDLTLDMEFRFADLRSKIQLHKPAAVVEPSVANVRDGLIEIDGMFGGVGLVAPLIALSSSFVIALREGLEAMLVIGAVLGALRSSHSRQLGRYILIGAGLAIIVSLVGWVLLHGAVSAAPVAQQVISAAASLVAVGMLLWMNAWLLRRRDPKRWMEMMRARTWIAMTSGSALGLALIGFSAVLRQGVETALLYEVLLGYSMGVTGYVALGALTALVGMVVAAWALIRTGRTISPVVFRRIAVPLLMLLSTAFVGGAIYQLQESGYVSTTSVINAFPRLPYFAAELTGIHPTAEGLGAQIALVVVYGVVLIWMRLHMSKVTALQAQGSV
jgi:high-affinity iron transporter